MATPSEMLAAGSALNAKRALDAAQPASSEQPLASESPFATTTSDAPTPPTDAALLEALKAARKLMAEKEKLMSTMVVPTEALQEVAKKKPLTIERLGEVPGFGPTRAERYGEPLLVCIRSHVAAIKEAGGRVGDAEDGAYGAAAEAPAAQPANAPATSVSSGEHVTIKYSHYTQPFAISSSGALDFRTVDEVYCLSHVFKGDFNIRLRVLKAASSDNDGAREIEPDGGRLKLLDEAGGRRCACGTFSGLAPKGEYLVVLEEDPKYKIEAPPPAKGAKGGTRGGSGGGGSGGGGSGGGGSGFGRAIGGATKGSSLVTAELKKLTPKELREGGAKYRQLLAERDLEDALGGDEDAILGEDASGCSCIFGNPCAAPHCCKDWKNRYEVATKHGWKGF